jgi:hypothetical protein
MDFDIGDEIVYTCSIANIPRPLQRESDWGYITGFNGDYIIIKFNTSGSVHRILPDAISHHPHSPKYIKQLFRSCLPAIKAAIEAREGRQVMLQKTPDTVRLYGPAHIVQDFITSQKRTKVNLRLLV